MEAALRRELQEELDLVVRAAEPWLQVRHAYARQSVLLDVWRVTAERRAMGPRRAAAGVGVTQCAGRFRVSSR